MKQFIVSVFALTISSTNMCLAQQGRMEQKIDSLISQMTIEEKLGQMQQYYVSEDECPHLKEYIKQGRVGSVLNAGTDRDIIELQAIAMKESRLKIPLIIGRDVIHGYKTVFPIPLGQAASWNPSLVQKASAIAASEASSQGINWTFAPMMDIARDPRWGRIAESLGEDPVLAASMASAMVRGFQEKNFAACAKHYVGYGAAEGGRDYNTTFIPESELRNTYLVPFKASAQAGVMTMMSAFSNLNGIPLSANKQIINGILKNEWQYKGFVVSDWKTHLEMITHGYCATEAEAAEKGIAAGVDMEMVSETYAQNGHKLLEQKKISIEQIDDAVRRILRVKFSLGLFDNPFRRVGDKLLLTDDNKATAKELASQSIVLLKNEQSILPIKNKKTIAVIGFMANERKAQMGCWTFDGDEKDVVTPLAAIKHSSSNTTSILYSKGVIDGRSADESHIKEAVSTALKADIVLFFCGEDELMSGEAHCRAFLDLPGAQNALFAALVKTGKPIVSIVLAGRPLAIENIDSQSKAVLYAWHPGTMGGDAIADILFGVSNPSGKLPVSFPRCVGQVPIYYNHLNTGRPANPSDHFSANTGTPLNPKHFTSSYIDVSITPLYPFGYGLSYATFSYNQPVLSTHEMTKNGELKITCLITNTSKTPGYEIPQLYIRDKFASLTRPVKELKAFEKVFLEPGQQKEVTFVLRGDDLGFYNSENSFVVEPGAFDLWVGPNSQEGQHTTFSIVDNPR